MFTCYNCHEKMSDKEMVLLEDTDGVQYTVCESCYNEVPGVKLLGDLVESSEENETNVRYFMYVGEPTYTRGEYGCGLVGGRSYDGKTIVSFDPDFGEMEVGFVDDEDWVEISEEEWEEL